MRDLFHIKIHDYCLLVDSLTCLKLANKQQIPSLYLQHHGGKLFK